MLIPRLKFVIVITSEYSLSFNCINGSKVTAKVVDSMRAIQLTTEDNLLDVNGVVVSMK